MTSRRSFLLGVGAALAAPALVQAESLMKIVVLRETIKRPALTETMLRQMMDDIYEDRLARAALVAERQVLQAFWFGTGWVRHDASGSRNIDPWEVFAK